MHSKIHSLFGSRQVHFRGTSKPITPFGGLISLVEFFGKIRLTNAIQEFASSEKSVGKLRFRKRSKIMI